MPCHTSCAACNSNATDCSSCRNVTGIVYFHINSNSCIVACPIGYAAQIWNNTCVLCHPYCSKCFRPDQFSFTNCKIYNSTIYYLIYGATTCSDICPPGQFASSTSVLCLVCDSNCATCYGTSKNCTSCYLVNGFYVYLFNNICLKVCPTGYYSDLNTKKC